LKKVEEWMMLCNFDLLFYFRF